MGGSYHSASTSRSSGASRPSGLAVGKSTTGSSGRYVSSGGKSYSVGSGFTNVRQSFSGASVPKSYSSFRSQGYDSSHISGITGRDKSSPYCNPVIFYSISRNITDDEIKKDDGESMSNNILRVKIQDDFLRKMGASAEEVLIYGDTVKVISENKRYTAINPETDSDKGLVYVVECDDIKAQDDSFITALEILGIIVLILTVGSAICVFLI